MRKTAKKIRVTINGARSGMRFLGRRVVDAEVYSEDGAAYIFYNGSKVPVVQERSTGRYVSASRER